MLLLGYRMYLVASGLIEYSSRNECLKIVMSLWQFCHLYSWKKKFNFIQYLVWPPFAFNTAAIRRGIFSIKPMHTCRGILFHSASTRSHNSIIPLGFVSYSASFLFRCAHKYSIGFKSGDCGSQSNTWIALSENHLRAAWEVCFGSLSCWKTILPLSNP